MSVNRSYTWLAHSWYSRHSSCSKAHYSNTCFTCNRLHWFNFYKGCYASLGCSFRNVVKYISVKPFRLKKKMTYSDSEVLIKVENTSKKFCRNFKKSLWYGIKDTASDIINITNKEQKLELVCPEIRNSKQEICQNHSPKLRESEFWAIRDISFELKGANVLD